MKKPHTWQEYVELAPHFLAVGSEEIYLSDTNDEPLDSFPWEFTTSIETGSTFRYNVAVSKWFRATHPSGLRFRWSIDLEKRGSNGSGQLQFNTAKLRLVAQLLPAHLATQYCDSFTDARKELNKQADDYSETAEKLRRDARALAF